MFFAQACYGIWDTFVPYQARQSVYDILNNARRCLSSKNLGRVKARMNVKTQYFNFGWNVFTKMSFRWRLLLVPNKQRACHEVQEWESPQDFSCLLPRICVFSDNLFSSCLHHWGVPSACSLSWNTGVTCLRRMWQKRKGHRNDKQTVTLNQS